MALITLLLSRPLFTLALILHLSLAEEKLVNQPVEISAPDHASNPNPPRVQTSPLRQKHQLHQGFNHPPLKQKLQFHQG
jgi:hypothetical protein